MKARQIEPTKEGALLAVQGGQILEKGLEAVPRQPQSARGVAVLRRSNGIVSHRSVDGGIEKHVGQGLAQSPFD